MRKVVDSLKGLTGAIGFIFTLGTSNAIADTNDELDNILENGEKVTVTTCYTDDPDKAFEEAEEIADELRKKGIDVEEEIIDANLQECTPGIEVIEDDD